MSTHNEADTRAKLIDPAIYGRGWSEEHIKREETNGTIELDPETRKPRRRSRGRVDYVLRLRVGTSAQPVAVALLEAKKEALPPGHGLDQAKGYARTARHNVPFVFSSNGHLFVEFDRTTGLTSDPRPLAQFPTPDELRARYEAHVGFSLEAPDAKPLLQPYPGGEGERRYFQDAAIRAVFEKIARCAASGAPVRALLSLATGSGKTFIAANLLKRLSDAGQMRRALFLCDRDELRGQGLRAMRRYFGDDACDVSEVQGENKAKNARVHVATYQTLGIDADGNASFLSRHYPPDYFSHLIIDECHRSAWGKWSEVLKRNPNAVQIGLTATPRQLRTSEDTPEAQDDQCITANNVTYFGEPVYEYGLAQAMEDGYLALCQIALMQVNLDATGLTLGDIVSRFPKNANTGQPVSAREIAQLYERTDFEKALMLPDRVRAMCFDLFTQIVQSDPEKGPHQKTVIFCARDRHADAVATEMNNLYANWCRANNVTRYEPFAFKCTGQGDGAAELPDFRGSSTSHFVATTVELLTTGVDVPAIRNVAFFKYLKSPISFYQMVGRGTRLDPATGKLMFRVYDYTGATRLFGSDFVTEPAREPAPKPEGGDLPPPPPPPPQPPIEVSGFEVHISPLNRYVVTSVDGVATPVTVEDFRARLSELVTARCETVAALRAVWVDPDERETLIDTAVSGGYSPEVLRVLEERADYDLFDVLADLCYGVSPYSRADRAFAFRYKNDAWLKAMPHGARAVAEAIADQFARGGTEGLENPLLWQTPAVVAAGGLNALATAGTPKDVLAAIKQRMFAA